MCRKFKFECTCHSGPKPTKYNVGTNIGTTFRQHCVNMSQCSGKHCVNVVAMSFSTLGTNIETMLRQHCVNVGAQHWGPMLRQRSCNSVWMLSQHRFPTLYLVGLGLQWQLHSNLNFLHIYNISMHLYIGTSTSTSIYEWSYLPWQFSWWADDGFSRHFLNKSTQLCLNGNSACQKHILALFLNSCFSF